MSHRSKDCWLELLLGRLVTQSNGSVMILTLESRAQAIVKIITPLRLSSCGRCHRSEPFSFFPAALYLPLGHLSLFPSSSNIVLLLHIFLSSFFLDFLPDIIFCLPAWFSFSVPPLSFIKCLASLIHSKNFLLIPSLASHPNIFIFLTSFCPNILHSD